MDTTQWSPLTGAAIRQPVPLTPQPGSRAVLNRASVETHRPCTLMDRIRIEPRFAQSVASAIAFLLLGTACAAAPVAIINDPDEPTWIRLFNGSDLDDWVVKIHRHETGVNYGNTFRAEDEMIRVRYDEYGDFDEQFGHLYYERPFSHYLLKLEYRFVGDLHPGSPDFARLNSGVMFHSQDPYTMPRDQNWPISVEMQFYAGLGDGRPRPTGNMCSPGTHVVFEGSLDRRHCINSTAPTFDRDRWVAVELLVLGDSVVKHIVEGDTVLTYTKPQIGGNVVQGYDPAVKQDGRILSEGLIALQSEGQPIDFRNVELLELIGCTDPAATNFKSYFVASDDSRCAYAG
jgi:hypothetical protein